MKALNTFLEGLLNRNNKSSNIFHEEIKRIITRSARSIYTEGYIPQDDWVDIENVLTPILGETKRAIPRGSNALVFTSWHQDHLFSIYIIDKSRQVAYRISVSNEDINHFEKIYEKVSISRSKIVNLVFKLGDDMMKELLNETYKVA